jgi:hypothetical protein
VKFDRRIKRDVAFLRLAETALVSIAVAKARGNSVTERLFALEQIERRAKALGVSNAPSMEQAKDAASSRRRHKPNVARVDLATH